MNNNYIRIAKEAIEEYLNSGRVINVPRDQEHEEVFKGVFVSLKKNGRLRGCIGTIRGQNPLGKEITNNAIASATEDPRFPPVTKEELENLDISVDILEPEEMVKDISELDPNQYGIIVEQGYKKGLLLPNLDGVDTVAKQIDIAKEKAGIIGNDFTIKKFRVTRYDGM